MERLFGSVILTPTLVKVRALILFSLLPLLIVDAVTIRYGKVCSWNHIQYLRASVHVLKRVTEARGSDNLRESKLFMAPDLTAKECVGFTVGWNHTKDGRSSGNGERSQETA